MSFRGVNVAASIQNNYSIHGRAAKVKDIVAMDDLVSM